LIAAAPKTVYDHFQFAVFDLFRYLLAAAAICLVTDDVDRTTVVLFVFR